MNRRGFTLLEVLLSIALVAALLGSMFTFLHELLQSRSRALDYTGRQRAAATLIERVESDLAACLVGDAVNGAGVAGNASRISILSRGVAAHLAERGIDSGVLGDLQKSEYRFDDRSGVIEIRRLKPGSPADTPAVEFVSIGNVFRLRFRYHDGTEWSDSFDSLASNALPAAVEIAVWYEPWPGEQEPSQTTAEAEAASERLTFDTTGGFDDAAYARQSDLEQFQEPRPDRFRVIVTSDASSDDPFATDLDMQESPEP